MSARLGIRFEMSLQSQFERYYYFDFWSHEQYISYRMLNGILLPTMYIIVRAWSALLESTYMIL